jgi:hypothetical protein
LQVLAEWKDLVYWAALFQPSSASSERVFGVMNALINGQQKSVAEVKLAAAAMLRYNDDANTPQELDDKKHKRINEVVELQLPRTTRVDTIDPPAAVVKGARQDQEIKQDALVFFFSATCYHSSILGKFPVLRMLEVETDVVP